MRAQYLEKLRKARRRTLLLASYAIAQSRRPRGQYVREINQDRQEKGEFATLIQELRDSDPERHFDYFRMSRERFDFLLSLVEERLQKMPTHASPVTPAERLAVTLRILATGMPQRAAAATYRLGYRTVCQIFNETIRVLWDVLQPVYVKQPDAARWVEVANEFYESADFPNCCGSVDGKHIAMQKPPGAGCQYYNYKGFHSIVLMAVADAKCRFLLVDVGGYGRSNDSGVFAQSQFGRALLDEQLGLPEPKFLPDSTKRVPHVLVGDEAFPLHTNLMRPYKRHELGDPERVFNYRLSRARRTIECAFGILARRWLILGKHIQAHSSNVEAIVLATVALHNFLMASDEQSCPDPQFRYDNVLSPDVQPPNSLLEDLSRPVRGGMRINKVIQNSFRDYFNSETGLARCPWQLESVRNGDY